MQSEGIGSRYGLVILAGGFLAWLIAMQVVLRHTGLWSFDPDERIRAIRLIDAHASQAEVQRLIDLSDEHYETNIPVSAEANYKAYADKEWKRAWLAAHPGGYMMSRAGLKGHPPGKQYPTNIVGQWGIYEIGSAAK
jgi:hypothetical protein